MNDTDLISVQTALHRGATWQHAYSGLERAIATSTIYTSIRLLLEEHSPCQA